MAPQPRAACRAVAPPPRSRAAAARRRQRLGGGFGGCSNGRRAFAQGHLDHPHAWTPIAQTYQAGAPPAPLPPPPPPPRAAATAGEAG